MWATLKLMYKTEGGFLALYRGITPTVAGVAPYVCRHCLHQLSHLLMFSQGGTKLYDV